MKKGGSWHEPEFDEQIEEEYRKASAEKFTQPPSVQLRPTEREKPFRWPGLDQRRDTVALSREDLDRMFGETPHVVTPSASSDPHEEAAPHEQDAGVAFVDDAPAGDLPESEEHAAVQEPETAPASPLQTQIDHWVIDLIDGPLLLMPSTDVIIGRRPGEIPGCSRLTIEDPGRTLSKSHVRLTLRGATWLIEDLGSTNGSALIAGDDEEMILAPGKATPVVSQFRIGTLRARLRPLIAQ